MNIEKAKNEMKNWIYYEKANKEKINRAEELIEIQETIINELDKQEQIIKNQSYTNKKLRKNYKGYRKLLKLKEKHSFEKNRIIDAMAECIHNYQICDYEITDHRYRKCEYISEHEVPPCLSCIKDYFKVEGRLRK